MKRSNIIAIFAAIIIVCSGFVIKGYLNNGSSTADSSLKRSVGLNIGDTAPEIDMAGPDGKNIKLSDYKNHIVLIDFWASWCRPCRMENPNVVKAYNNFKDKKMNGGKKGFMIFSVSLDNNGDAWKAAISADGLSWTAHVSDLKGWGNAAAQTYGINSIPNNYLVDGEGVIIAKNLRGENLEVELEKLVKK